MQNQKKHVHNYTIHFSRQSNQQDMIYTHFYPKFNPKDARQMVEAIEF